MAGESSLARRYQELKRKVKRDPFIFPRALRDQMETMEQRFCKVPLLPKCDEIEKGPAAGESALARRWQELKRAVKRDPFSFPKDVRDLMETMQQRFGKVPLLCDEVDAWAERHGRFPRQRGPVAGEDALARRHQVLKRALKNDPDSLTTAMAQRIAATTLVESRVRVAANLAEAERRRDAKRARLA